MRRFTLGLGLASLCALALGCSKGSDKDDEVPNPMTGPIMGQAGAAPVAGMVAPGPTAGMGVAGGAVGTAGGAGQAMTPVAGGGGAAGTPSTMTAGTGVAGGTAGSAGSSTTSGSGGSSGAPMAGTDDPKPADDHKPSCIDDAKDVVMIGDSYIDWITHTFVADMRAEAGQQWPSYAIGGTSMATGGIGHIPDQLDTALADNKKIKAVVMTGGGNDILVADTIMFPQAGMCTSTPTAPMIEDCKKIVQAALDEAKALMNKTADAGVRDIIYFFYPHIPGGGLISGPSPNEMLDYALPRAREVCESSLERTNGRMKCTFVDMVPVFMGKTGLFADAVSEAGDGVHPNSMGSKVMAKEIWRVMKEGCIGQPSSSGCCQKATP